MADLSELQATQGVKIAAADSTGLETEWIQGDGSGGMKVAAKLQGYSYSGYSPDPSNYPTTNQTDLAVDGANRLEAHATCTSDEGSFRDDFSFGSLTSAITGTLTFTNGSYLIFGSGSSFTTEIKVGQWVKKTSDSESTYAEVLSINSDTQITISTPYAGTTASTTGVVSNWLTATGTGASIAVASSVCTINSGTNTSAITTITRSADYLPATVSTYCAISQRIANQTARIGLMNSLTNPAHGCFVEFTGATNTIATFVTVSTTAASDRQATNVTLPGGAVTSSYNTYKMDVSGNSASLSINGTVVATHLIHIPAPYDTMGLAMGFINSGAVTTTALTVDMFYFYNNDRIQIDNDFNGEPLRVTISDSSVPVTVSNFPATQAISGTVAISNFPATQPVSGTLAVTQSGTWSEGRTWTLGSGTDSVQAIPVDGTKATYSATSAIAFASPATATDIFTLTGSASKTVRVLRVGFSATQTTAAAVNVLLLKRSTANTSGTSAAATRVSHDSTDAAATATVLNYTANPTTGTLVGTIRAVRAFIPTASLASASQYYEFNFADRPEKAPVLRGTGEVLALNLNSVTVAGGAWTCFVEWTEE